MHIIFWGEKETTETYNMWGPYCQSPRVQLELKLRAWIHINLLAREEQIIVNWVFGFKLGLLRTHSFVKGYLRYIMRSHHKSNTIDSHAVEQWIQLSIEAPTHHMRTLIALHLMLNLLILQYPRTIMKSKWVFIVNRFNLWRYQNFIHRLRRRWHCEDDNMRWFTSKLVNHNWEAKSPT